MTLLLAGHETTATSVAWAIERLVRHPEKLERLVGGDRRGRGGEEYMTAVVSETLRVRPVVPMVVRMLKEELRVGELRAAGGHARGAVDLPDEPQPARVRGAARVPARSASWRAGRRRSRGSRSAAGSAAASARRSRQLEMKLMLRTMLGELEPSLPRRGRGVAPGRVEPRGARSRWSRRRARGWCGRRARGSG